MKIEENKDISFIFEEYPQIKIQTPLLDFDNQTVTFNYLPQFIFIKEPEDGIEIR